MRFSFIVLGASLALAAPSGQAAVRTRDVDVDNYDLLRASSWSTLIEPHSPSPHSQPSSHEDGSETTTTETKMVLLRECPIMTFFRTAPRYLMESLSRSETINAASGVLPIFWRNRDSDSDNDDDQIPEQQDPSPETLDLEHLREGQILTIKDGNKSSSWVVQRYTPSGGLMHRILVWAHVGSFAMLIAFTVLYAAAFILRSLHSLQYQNPEHKVPDLDEKKPQPIGLGV